MILSIPQKDITSLYLILLYFGSRMSPNDPCVKGLKVWSQGYCYWVGVETLRGGSNLIMKAYL